MGRLSRHLGANAVWTKCDIPGEVIPEGDDYSLQFQVRIMEGDRILDHGAPIRSRT